MLHNSMIPLVTEQDELPAKLQSAILLYGSSNHSTPSYATHHKVAEGVIQPGELLSVEQATCALAGIVTGSTARNWSMTEPNVVATGALMKAWWTPPCVATNFYEAELEIASGETHHPALFWVCNNQTLWVWALEQASRPDASTQLLHAPHMNVWRDGKVCQGSSVLPKGSTPDAWVAAFHLSSFSHPNDRHLGNWQTKHPEGVLGLWRELNANREATSFPNQHLMPANLTVEQAIERACNESSRPLGRG